MTQTNGTASVTVDGLLFDMDGTLLDSTPAVVATWEQYAREYDLDLDHVLKSESRVGADSESASTGRVVLRR